MYIRSWFIIIISSKNEKYFRFHVKKTHNQNSSFKIACITANPCFKDQGAACRAKILYRKYMQIF